MLQTFSKTHKTNWKDHVNKLIHQLQLHRARVDRIFTILPAVREESSFADWHYFFYLKSDSAPSCYAEYVSKCKTAVQQAYSCAS